MPNFAAFAKPTFVFASIVSASTSREMSFTGNGCRRIALTTVKIVVFAPIPSASDNIATALNPGLFSSTLAPCFTSCQNVSILPSQLELKAHAPFTATLRLWRQILVPQLWNLQVPFPRTRLLLALPSPCALGAHKLYHALRRTCLHSVSSSEWLFLLWNLCFLCALCGLCVLCVKFFAFFRAPASLARAYPGTRPQPSLYALPSPPYTARVATMGLPGLPHHFLRTVALLCSFVAFFAAAARPRQRSQSDKPEPKPSAEKAPENPAQIELLETRIRFEANGDSRKEVHARVHINNELGVRQFARLNFDYNRSFESVEIPLVHIAHPSGGSADILPSAITDNPNPAVVNYPAYHDVRVKSVRILGLEPGDLLEYRVITTVSHHPLAPDFWLDHSFDRTGVVTEEIFALDLPGHLNSTATMGNWHGGSRLVVYLTVQHTSYRYDPSQGASGRSIYRWELPSTRKLPAPVDDGGAPAPDVLVSSFPTWFELVTRLAPHLLNWPADDRKEAEARLRSFAPTAG